MKRGFGLCLVLAALTAHAQDSGKTNAPNVRYNRTTTINFDDDDTIEGDLTRPDGEYVEATKRVKHSNLIRIREEFKDKLMESVSEL
jgi:hypothetical protein